jgi:hypothetical protein
VENTQSVSAPTPPGPSSCYILGLGSWVVFNWNSAPKAQLGLKDIPSPASRPLLASSGPISPLRGVRRGPQRLGEGVWHFAQKQQIRNEIIAGGTG